MRVGITTGAAIAHDIGARHGCRFARTDEDTRLVRLEDDFRYPDRDSVRLTDDFRCAELATLQSGTTAPSMDGFRYEKRVRPSTDDFRVRVRPRWTALRMGTMRRTGDFAIGYERKRLRPRWTAYERMAYERRTGASGKSIRACARQIIEIYLLCNSPALAAGT